MSLKKRKVSPTFDNLQEQEYLYKGPNHAANLNDMRLKDKYCDITIKVDGKEIRAHKVILAANLKYFETMFSSDSFQKSHDGVIYTMESVKKADLESFVSYAYTGEILLTEDNALNLMELANHLSEDDIRKACIDFLEKNLKVEEACRAHKFAKTIECLSLMNAAKEKILANFEDCSKSADYLNLDSESLMNILSDDKAQSIQNQKILFERILTWIVHDAQARKIFMEDLFSFIDVTKLQANDVTGCLYNNIVHRNDEYGITKDAIFYYEASKIKRKKEHVLMIISEVGSFQFYDFTEKKWFSQQQIPNAAFHRYANNSSTVFNDKLYYISDISGKNYLQVLDPSTKQITRLHSSKSILKYAMLCACSRFLYICGGVKADSSRSDQILRYDPQTNSLETLARMKLAKSSPAVIFYEGCLYVLGGFDGSSTLHLVEKYDPVSNEWTTCASMCKKRHGHAVAILNDKLYACGGYSDMSYESSVEKYDPTTNSWQLVASMNKTRCYFLVVAHKDKLLTIGGADDKTVEAYDPGKDQWQVDHEMSSGLQVDYCVGGLIPSGCITNTDL